MFEVVNRRNKSRTVLQMLELIFNWSVREVSNGHKSAVGRIASEAMQLVFMIIAFSSMMMIFGAAAASPIKGDGLLFLTSGILLFMLFNSTMSAIFGAEQPDHPIMQHAPMNTFVAMCARAIATLYAQTIIMAIVFFAYYLYVGELHIANPIGALKYFIYCWWSGVCIGIFLRGMAIFAPKATEVIKMAYMGANMVFSGKMTPANYVAPVMLPWFAWNPLFHLIDRFRGEIFINYTAHKTDVAYAMQVSTVLLVFGLLSDYYGRQRMRGRQNS